MRYTLEVWLPKQKFWWTSYQSKNINLVQNKQKYLQEQGHKTKITTEDARRSIN
jgi:hypothetical protein